MGYLRTSIRPTATRVEESTAPEVEDAIHRQTEVNLAKAAARPGGLEQRLCELNEEWDIERVLQTNFAVVTVVSTVLGALAARRWHLLTAVAAGFMAQHTFKGWCPPLPVFRRLGFRTLSEIEQERYALKALRGDFKGIGGDAPTKAFDAAAVT